MYIETINIIELKQFELTNATFAPFSSCIGKSLYLFLIKIGLSIFVTFITMVLNF